MITWDPQDDTLDAAPYVLQFYHDGDNRSLDFTIATTHTEGEIDEVLEDLIEFYEGKGYEIQTITRTGTFTVSGSYED